MGDVRNSLLWVVIGLPGFLAPVSAALAGEQESTGEGGTAATGEIVVIGSTDESRALTGMFAESELDENGIAAFGVDSVGDLLAEILPLVDRSEEGPIILINGRPATGINEVSDLPTEAVTKIQVLPRQAAGALGQSPTRRVVNVVIKPNHRQLTTSVFAGFATAGGGFETNGELNLLFLKDSNRRSIALKARHADPLFEGDRDILSDVSGTPYDFTGNVVSYPVGGSNIDPALSLLAGQTVLVAGVPAGVTNPSLAAFAARAGRANSSDLGRYRTLISRTNGVSANANLTQKLSNVSTLALNFAAERGWTGSFTGATPLDLRLPGTSPFTPFSRDVTIARYLGNPLGQNSDSTGLSFAAILNTQLGNWRLNFNSAFAHRVSHTDSERGVDTAALQAGVLAGTVNPFAGLPASLVSTVLTDRSRSRSDTGNTYLTITGSPFNLPAGPVTAAARLEWRANRTASRTVGSTTTISSRLKRDEEIAQLSLQMPIVGGVEGPSPIGQIGLELSGALRHITGSGGLEDYGFGVNWRIGEVFSFRGAVSNEQIAPPPNTLSDPVITLDSVRTYDFIRQETVFVRYTTGGNPNLKTERRRTTTFTVTFNPFPDKDFSLNAEYQQFTSRDAFSALPPVNAEVQGAFPDRFVRDTGGRLIAVDARPVPFARVQREQFRWGADFSLRFGQGGGDGETPVLASGWRINGFLSHTWMLSSTRLARIGLPVVDLLEGGAAGYGGGQPRHFVQFGGGAIHKGVGLQFDGNWQSGSRIDSGTLAAPDTTFFAPRLTVDARLFGNLGPLFPESGFAKGMRLSLRVENLFDSRERVTDRTGATPLRYQPYLLDPLGRRLTFGVRKVF